MKSIMAGPNGSAMPGQVIDVEESVALHLERGGYADFVDAPPKVETAMIEPPENADNRPKAKRGRKNV